MLILIHLLIIEDECLITEANCQLGSEINDLKKYTEIFFNDLPDLDICNYPQLEKFVLNRKINAIINFAAYTYVDKAEEDAETAIKVNAEGVLNLVKAIENVNGKTKREGE